MENELSNTIKRDLNYIKRDIIAQQSNGKYCKYSRLAKSITAVNMTFDSYLTFWINNLRSRRFTGKSLDLVRETITNKFNSELTELDTIIKLEMYSSDSDKEKNKIIKEITTV